MKLKSVLLIVLVFCSAAVLFPQQAGRLSIADLKDPSFRLSTAVPGVLIVRPFNDLFPETDIHEFFTRPQLRLFIRRAASQAKSNVRGIAADDQWEFQLPKLDPGQPYVAEFTLEGQLSGDKATAISSAMVKDSKFMDDLGFWAGLATNRLGPQEPSLVPPADRLKFNDPVPKESLEELHEILLSELKKHLPNGITIGKLSLIDADEIRKFRNTTIHLIQESRPYRQQYLDHYSTWIEELIANAMLAAVSVHVDFYSSQTTGQDREKAMPSGRTGQRSVPEDPSHQPSPVQSTTVPSTSTPGPPSSGSSEKYGPFGGLVRTAGAIMSAALAVVFTWRRRSRWEPSEQDIDKGAERVAGLLTAVLMVILWSRFADTSHGQLLTNLSFILAPAAAVMLIVYGYLVSNQTYFLLKDEQGHDIPRRNIIGGFWLTEYAKGESKYSKEGHPPLTLQKLLEKVDFNADLVWSRPSRSTAKAIFVICYILLIVFGSVALACAAAIAWLANQPTPR